jgi:general stress protein 26
MKKIMDSINQQQQEDNYKDLYGEEAKKKIKDLAESAKTCFFCTGIEPGKPFSTRPMAVQEIDVEGNFWFLSSNESNKNHELKTDPEVQLLFQGSTHSDFLNIYGKAIVSNDKEKIKELWQPALKTWFTDGVDDSRISIIKVEPESGYYWDTKHSMPIAFIKRLAGAAMGKTLDDSIEGQIKI